MPLIPANRFLIRALAGLTAGLALVVCAVPVQAGNHPPSEVLVEAGYVKPYGDLAAPFLTTPKGLGITQGMELGFRWRYRFSDHWSLAPGFQFIDYRNYTGTNPQLGDYRIQPTTLRYELELMCVMLDPGKTVRPLIAVSAAVLRNRLQGFYKTWDQAFDTSVNNLGFSARAGIRTAGFEFTVVYHYNRFDTWRFFNTGYEESYDWDNLVLRVAWIIPF